jgi:polysaccharide biosynthesis transport protein
VSTLRRRWRVIAIVAACALVGTAGGILLAKPDYTSTATLQIPAASRVGANVGRDDLDYADRVTNTYQRMTSSASLRADVQRRLRTEAEIHASAHPVRNTELMDVEARAPGPALAQRAANAYADALVAHVRALNDDAGADIRARVEKRIRAAEEALAQLRVRLDQARDGSVRDQLAEMLRLRQAAYDALAQQSAIVDVAAGADRMPSVAERARFSAAETGGRGNIALGLLLGLVAGAGVALLLERRAPQLTTLEDIERAAGAPVLATIPAGADGQILLEAFNEMRARLLSAGGNGTRLPRSVLITSPRDGDGKSLVAANLARALARAQRDVVLVDADFQEPSQHEVFELDNEAGLADLLRAKPSGRALWSFVQATPVANFSVLTSGMQSPSARELLAAPRMGEIIAQLGRRYDFVVVDSASLGTVSDAAVLASLVDAVVLVMGRTPASDELIQSARRQLDITGDRRLWLVVNRWRGGKRHAGALRRARHDQPARGVRFPEDGHTEVTYAESRERPGAHDSVPRDHGHVSLAKPGDRPQGDTKNGASRPNRATRHGSGDR